MNAPPIDLRKHCLALSSERSEAVKLLPFSRDTKPTPAIVIAGMHRSGTSLLTSFLAAMGLDVGQNLLPADANSRRGYLEDQRFLELNRRLVAACCDPGDCDSGERGLDDSGHPDWGWTEEESFDASALGALRGDGRRLLEDLGPRQKPWGFKDPRSTLLLDYWDHLLEDARYVFVYRNPWDVSESMQRLGSEVFLRRPDYAPRIWSFYNRHLLDFYRRHAERCVLVSVHAFLEQPEAFAELVSSKLGLELEEAPLETVYEVPMLTNAPFDDSLPRLFAATHPEVLLGLDALEAAADLPTGHRWADPDFAGGPLRPYRFTPSPEATEPPVAVVIPCRDLGHFLIEAIASVERAIPMPYELIIVDDGSKQTSTIEILERLEAAGYRIERVPASGVCAARNKGFELVRAPYIIPLDADNRLRPGPFLGKALAELEADPGLGVVYGDRHEFGLREGRMITGAFDLHKILDGNYIDTCAVIRRTTWSDAGGYDEELLTWEDWELWIRIARRGWRFRHIDHVAFDYRVRPGSLVSLAEDPRIRNAILDRVVKGHREVFEQHLIRQLGHSLAAWLFYLLEERDRLRGSWTASHQGALGSTEARQEPLTVGDSFAAPGDFELARARLAALQSDREAERANWRLDHAKTSAKHFEESAKQLQDTLAARNEVVVLQQAVLEDLRNRAELAEQAYRNVKREAVAREQKLQRLDLALKATTREVEDLRKEVERPASQNRDQVLGILA